MLNRKQIEQFLEEESIFISDESVTAYRAVELFEEKAIDFVLVRENKCGVEYNTFGMGENEDSIDYLTHEGFLRVPVTLMPLKQ